MYNHIIMLGQINNVRIHVLDLTPNLHEIILSDLGLLIRLGALSYVKAI